MLSLRRCKGERIIIETGLGDIEIQVSNIKPGVCGGKPSCVISIDAPEEYNICRSELKDTTQRTPHTDLNADGTWAGTPTTPINLNL